VAFYNKSSALCCIDFWQYKVEVEQKVSKDCLNQFKPTVEYLHINTRRNIYIFKRNLELITPTQNYIYIFFKFLLNIINQQVVNQP